MSGRLVMKLYD
jgi:C2 domain